MGAVIGRRDRWGDASPSADEQAEMGGAAVGPRPGAARRLGRVAARCLGIALVLALPAVLIVDVARRETPPPTAVTDDDLLAFVVRREDLPPGYALTSETRSDGEDLSRYFSDPERVRAMLETWGRQGSAATLLTNDGPAKLREPWQAASAVERYPDAGRAAMRWHGRGALYGDWNAEPRAVRSVRGPHVGDQSTASRMELTDEAGRDLVVYSVVFRNGPIVADITTTALRHKDDRGRQAFRLARLVNERVDSHLRPDTGDDLVDRPLSLEVVHSVQNGWRDLRDEARSAGLGEIIARLEEARDSINRTAELLR
jgi:hypothetical protein